MLTRLAAESAASADDPKRHVLGDGVEGDHIDVSHTASTTVGCDGIEGRARTALTEALHNRKLSYDGNLTITYNTRSITLALVEDVDRRLLLWPCSDLEHRSLGSSRGW